MDILNIVSKYCTYALYLLGVVSFGLLIKNIINIRKISKKTNRITKTAAKINRNIDTLKRKQTTINHTFKVTVPFFIKTFIAYKLSGTLLRKLFIKRKKKKDLKDRLELAYDYGKTIKAASDVAKIIKETSVA